MRIDHANTLFQLLMGIEEMAPDRPGETCLREVVQDRRGGWRRRTHSEAFTMSPLSASGLRVNWTADASASFCRSRLMAACMSRAPGIAETR